ncbi:pollen-specific leucine-rich repeat extensin-like protein 1 isoform X2 [Xiphias gladius]|uniref:pollen-specific leucine-rich repeat extensin-like protein 1 isoform X2 n=1 Tax=Xiphias gladius TaxID=8245 RepID=UPI001A998E53|nr:pollen-specific leucine-rich repeat extensin-like protein 1 isoform X2 [Xiphias gladius]
MEPFYHLLPSSTTRDLPSPHPSLRRLDLQAITNDWLSLTMDTSASTPAHSVTTTPVPPTPPPLPTDLASFRKVQEPRTPPPSPLPAPTQRGLPLSPLTFSRTPPFKEGRLSLGHTPVVLPFCQISTPSPHPPPPPPPAHHSSLTSPLPDSSLRYNGGFTEAGRVLHIAKPEVFSCTKPEPINTPTQIALRHKSTTPVNKSSKTPDVKLQVKDPYDELLSMILNGSTNIDDADFSRLCPVDSSPVTLTNESQSRFKLKAEESHQPAGKPPAVTPASKPAGSIRLAVLFHKPVTMKPLSITWGRQPKTLNEDEPVEFQRPPPLKGKNYSELFIEEEDEALEEKEEDIRVLNESLSPQADVSPSTVIRLSHPGLSSPSIPPPLTSLPPPSSSTSSFAPPSSSSSCSQQHDHNTIPPSPPCSPRPPSLPHLTTSPLSPVSPSPPVSPAPLDSSHPSPNVLSQHSVSQPSSAPCPSLPITACTDSKSPIHLPAPSPPKPASPPLATTHSPPTPPTVPHPGHRSPKVKDPVVGGKPPRSPILSRRSYLSPVRGRRVGGHVFIQPCSYCTLVSVQGGNNHIIHDGSSNIL